MRKLRLLLVSALLTASVFAQQKPVYQGQGPTQAVETISKAIERQVRRTFSFPSGVSFSNQFEGARLNVVEQSGPFSYTVGITPENTPVNPSPWYAFKVWSTGKSTVSIRFTYPEGVRHRYSPLTSHDGLTWKPVDARDITIIEKGTADFGPDAGPKSIEVLLEIGKKPLWISAQELNTSKHVFAWIAKTSKVHRLQVEDIGTSTDGRPIRMMTIGNPKAKNNIIVISRQHPPEVTGYFAMQAFVERLLGNDKLARAFRDDWAIYVVPLMNPDGVDEGHWRHNAGGVDLNRDWTVFNQPEGKAVSEFLKKREAESDGKFYFGIDFHSTWDDIYYPMDRKYQSSLPGLMYEWLDGIKKSIPGYEPNIKPSANAEPAIVSRNYFFLTHGMEAIVFEIGDNTPRDFIKKKGSVGATELMKLLMERRPKSVAATVK